MDELRCPFARCFGNILFYVNINVFCTAALNIDQASHKLLCKHPHSALPANVGTDPTTPHSWGLSYTKNANCTELWEHLYCREEAKMRLTKLIFTWDQRQNVSSTLQTSKTCAEPTVPLRPEIMSLLCTVGSLQLLSQSAMQEIQLAKNN